MGFMTTWFASALELKILRIWRLMFCRLWKPYNRQYSHSPTFFFFNRFLCSFSVIMSGEYQLNFDHLVFCYAILEEWSLIWLLSWIVKTCILYLILLSPQTILLNEKHRVITYEALIKNIILIRYDVDMAIR